MAKEQAAIGKKNSRMVNVSIAPGNESRLKRYIEWHNGHPARSRPPVTATDILNESLDAFLSELDARNAEVGSGPR